VSVRKRLEFLKDYARLFSRWEAGFIRDMWWGIDGTPDFLHDEAIKEYLSENQIKKIKEIWSKWSPHINQETPKAM
jgi:capsule polysaccharide export protein KpsC/LpsZ